MDQTVSDKVDIYSPLADDPDLRQIVEMFVQEMPGRTTLLLNQLLGGDWQALRSTLHQLKGAAGSYGFDPISHCAAKAESTLRNNASEEDIRAAIEELIELCGHARGGRPA